MAARTFRIFRLTDAEIINKLEHVNNAITTNNKATLTIRVGDNIQQIENIPLSQVNDNPQLKPILNSTTYFCDRLTLNINDDNHISVVVGHKPEGVNELTVNFANNNLPFEEAHKLFSKITENFPVYDPMHNIDKALGPELNEFYRVREQGVVRLEELSNKLIIQNEEYRRNLDQELLRKQRELEEKQNQMVAAIENERKVLYDATEKREKELDERVKQLDDRDNRHSRRQIRNDIKEELNRRSERFNLTLSTRMKRYPIHLLFIGLIFTLLILTVLSYSKLTTIQTIAGWQNIFNFIRFPLLAISCVVTIIFYIRWNDHWAQMHADEEFRLKRLDLDIDRASWVVEMAMEWQEEKGGALPQELLDRLTANLFIDKQSSGVTNHPYEDVIKGLLSVSTEAEWPIPGGGKVKIDRKGTKKLAGE